MAPSGKDNTALPPAKKQRLPSLPPNSADDTTAFWEMAGADPWSLTKGQLEKVCRVRSIPTADGASIYHLRAQILMHQQDVQPDLRAHISPKLEKFVALNNPAHMESAARNRFSVHIPISAGRWAIAKPVVCRMASIANDPGYTHLRSVRINADTDLSQRPHTDISTRQGDAIGLASVTPVLQSKPHASKVSSDTSTSTTRLEGLADCLRGLAAPLFGGTDWTEVSSPVLQRVFTSIWADGPRLVKVVAVGVQKSDASLRRRQQVWAGLDEKSRVVLYAVPRGGNPFDEIDIAGIETVAYGEVDILCDGNSRVDVGTLSEWAREQLK